MTTKQREISVIIDSVRDRKVYHYLVKCKGEYMVDWASKNLDGNRKPYVSNIAKKLKVDIPPENELPDPDRIISVGKGVEMLSQVIRIRKRK